MQTENRESIKITIILVIIFSLFSSIFIFLIAANQRPRNMAKDLKKQVSDILEMVYDEGFAPSKIDYTDPVLLSRNIFLTTDLDEKAATEVMMKLKYLESLNGQEAINLHIETKGGYGGIMLGNYMQTITCPVNTIALDYCCSAGCEVLASGTGTRKAFSSSRIIVHIVKTSDSNIDDKRYNSTRLLDTVTANYWKTHSKLTEAFYQRDSDVLFNLTAEEALEFGIIDEIIR